MNKQLIINDGKTHWIYLKDMNEVQIMNYDPEEDQSNSGDYQVACTGFESQPNFRIVLESLCRHNFLLKRSLVIIFCVA